jgi:L-ascorbate metabolism protein UlaG (beta-lactamase superfamily)
VTEIRWFGHSAFHFAGDRSVFIDPFGPPPESMTGRGNTFTYAPIRDARADLLLITHEHFDHNAADAVDGDPVIIRSTAGRIESPVGEVLAVASEHDAVAGTARGPNTIFAFTLGDLRICHFGDFGQAGLRGEQEDALGRVDVLLLPVGGFATIGGTEAAAVAQALSPRVVIPMHYGTAHVNWLHPHDDFLSALGWEVVETAWTARLEELVGEAESRRVAVMAIP